MNKIKITDPKAYSSKDKSLEQYNNDCSDDRFGDKTIH